MATLLRSVHGSLRRSPWTQLQRRGVLTTVRQGPLRQQDPKQAPKFSTNPSSEHFRQFAVQLKRVAKLTTYTAVAFGAGAFILWQSYHLYVEQCLEPTPSELTYRARNLLHGAHVREKIAPDFEMAATYVRHVIAIALEQQKLPETSDTLIQLRLRLADNERRAGNVLTAITEYTRAWKMLMLRDATEDKPDPLLIAETAKRMGDLYVRAGDDSQAEEYLAYALHQLSHASTTEATTWLKVTTMSSLASLYAVQRNFELALPLFLRALKAVPSDAARDWTCLKAILQNQLSEVMYGMNKHEEALGWAQASLESCVIGADLDHPNKYRDCVECGAVVCVNLGKLLERKGDLETALGYYKQALAYATAIQDTASQGQASGNLERLTEQMRTQDTSSQVTSIASLSPEQSSLSSSSSSSSSSSTSLPASTSSTSWLTRLWK